MKNLKYIWFIAIKDLKLFVTDRGALFFFIAFPFLFVALFSFVLSDVGSEDERLELHLVTQEDRGGLSHQIAKSIETEDSEGNAEIIEMHIDNESAAAEIRQFRSEQNSIPSVWLIHLPVDDLVESLRRVSEGGGEVIREYAEEKYAVVRDPVGVYLALRFG